MMKIVQRGISSLSPVLCRENCCVAQSLLKSVVCGLLTFSIVSHVVNFYFLGRKEEQTGLPKVRVACPQFYPVEMLSSCFASNHFTHSLRCQTRL